MSEQPTAGAPAGWYPHQTMVGTLRYWNGRHWTDDITAGQVTPPAPPKPSRVNWKVLVGTLGTIAVLLAAGWFFLDYNSGESKASRACHDYVVDRLKAPSTADFSDEFAVKDGDTYSAYGNVDSENGFGAKVRNAFTCEVTGGVVTDSHFSEDDDDS